MYCRITNYKNWAPISIVFRGQNVEVGQRGSGVRDSQEQSRVDVRFLCECVCAMDGIRDIFTVITMNVHDPLPPFTHEEAHTTNPHNGHKQEFWSGEKGRMKLKGNC